MEKLEINILRGKENIGENLIEITDGVVKILLECGMALNETQKTKAIEENVLSTYYDAVIISHYHPDHAGLLDKEVKTGTIYMGKATFDILKHCKRICTENEGKIKFMENEQPIFIDDIEIKPYLCDHSAYDSYMVEIKKGGQSVLYTGDFRSNGRKSFPALLKRLPDKIDILITEGTNPLSHNYTERFVEEKAFEIMKRHKRVFFLQSTLNIDRLVSFYRATAKSKKPFIMALPSAEIASFCKNIPTPSEFDNCYTYVRHRVGDVRHTRIKKKYEKNLISRDNIAMLEAFSMQVLSSMGHYLKKLSESVDLRDSVLIYSMWQGYKAEPSIAEFLETVKTLGIEIVDLHVSGHADKETIKMLVKRTNPEKIITVHSADNIN